MRLSIAMPVFNFAEFLPATLHSILDQPHGRDVEVVVTDGASTDATPAIMRDLCARYSNLSYNRLPEKGGIDRDMALAVAATGGDYVWLFSGDDIMHAGALAVMIEKVRSGADVYLCRHVECTSWMEPLFEYPIFDPDLPGLFDLADAGQRRAYFGRAQNSEAFFSFCGGLVIRRSTWDRVAFDPAWDGTCWAHAARLFAAIEGGLVVDYLGRALLDRRADNDSFSRNGHVERARIQVDGFHDLMNRRFGARSLEAREMRRAVRNEFPRVQALVFKLLCHAEPKRESKRVLDRIVARAYGDMTPSCLKTRLLYLLMSPDKIRRLHGGQFAGYFDPEAYRAERQRRKTDYEARLQAGSPDASAEG